jgi:hypothetical protein
MANLARHNPEVYFESQGGWPDPPTTGDWYPGWANDVDAEAADPTPEDLVGPCGQAFPDQEPPW